MPHSVVIQPTYEVVPPFEFRVPPSKASCCSNWAALRSRAAPRVVNAVLGNRRATLLSRRVDLCSQVSPSEVIVPPSEVIVTF